MIMYLRTSRWTSQQRLVTAGALLAALAALAWSMTPVERSRAPTAHAPLSDRPSLAQTAVADQTRLRDIEPPSPTGEPPATAAQQPAADAASNAPIPPFRYVGHWTERGTSTVVLSGGGQSVVVRVPGRFDERYEVLSVDDARLVVRFLPTGSVRTLELKPGAAWLRGSVPVRASEPGRPQGASAGELSTLVAPGMHVTPLSVPVGTTPRPAASNERDSEPEN